MRRYSVAQARDRLAEVLDGAEAGEEVVIERRGVRFVVRQSAAPAGKLVARRPSRVEIVDPAVADGTWNWSWSDSRGTRFRPRHRRAR